MSRPDDETERKFLRSFARGLGVEELSAEALATSLGLDELTPEKLDAWFAEQVASARIPTTTGVGGSGGPGRRAAERPAQAPGTPREHTTPNPALPRSVMSLSFANKSSH